MHIFHNWKTSMTHDLIIKTCTICGKTKTEPWYPIAGWCRPPKAPHEFMNKEFNIPKDTNIKLELKDIKDISTGLYLVDAFRWSKGGYVNFNSILQSDKETKDILIKESDLMKLIQLVMPTQNDRHIRLI